MSTTEDHSSTTDSTGKQYRIELGDIRGVGSRTIEYLETAGITSVRETHLLRNRGSPASQTLLSRGVSSDTLTHLRAVGKAVHYTGADRVKAKHLTLPEANHARDSSYISLLQEADPTGGSDDASDQQTLASVDQYDPDTDALADALDAIRAEYESGMQGQNALVHDIAEFVRTNDRFDEDDSLPQQVVFSVLRYEHAAERVMEQGDYEPKHGSLLIAFAEQL